MLRPTMHTYRLQGFLLGCLAIGMVLGILSWVEAKKTPPKMQPRAAAVLHPQSPVRSLQTRAVPPRLRLAALPAGDALEEQDQRPEDLDEEEMEELVVNPEEMEELVRDNTARLVALRRVEAENTIRRLAQDLELSPEDISRLKMRAQEIVQPPAYPTDEDALFDYVQFMSMDADAQLQRRRREGLEAQLLTALGQKGSDLLQRFAAQADAKQKDAWVLRLLSEFQLSLDLTEAQRTTVFQTLLAFATRHWDAITSPEATDLTREETRREIVEAMEQVVTAEQQQMLYERWRVNGLISG